MRKEYIYNLRDKKLPDSIGTKAKHLRFLIQKKFQTPETYVCTWDAYVHYINHAPALRTIIDGELLEKIDCGRHYAVRSSANLEDNKSYSFAGQFKSILNVTGRETLLQGIESIWSSATSNAVQSYLKRTGIKVDAVKMAVLIQEMVPPVVSGVSFSKNPMTGVDEIIVEAVLGDGERLHQEGVTPERWVYKWGGWIHEPENPTVDPQVVATVVATTKEIAASYGSDVDLEWVYDGTTLNWVQLREITSLHNMAVYSNTFAREVLPGIIKPLVWSINVPVVCGAWIRLFNELIGAIDIEPSNLAKSFYYRAYFNMGTIGRIFEMMGLPANTIESLMAVECTESEKPSFKPTRKTLKLLPRMLRFAYQKLRFKNDLAAFLASMRTEHASFPVDALKPLSGRELISGIERLYGLSEQTSYFMIITYLHLGLYNGLLKQRLKKYGITFEDIDLTGDMELHEYDPTIILNGLSRRFKELDERTRRKIAEGSYQDFMHMPGVDEFKKDVKDFIHRFGHLSDSGNDFSSVTWRENLDAILGVIVKYSTGHDHLPRKVNFEKLALPALTKKLLKPLYKSMCSYRYYREAVGSLCTIIHSIFRSYFLALAEIFTRQGIIEQRDDIFLLTYDEIKEIVARDMKDDHAKDTIASRKKEMEEYANIILPSIIYGEQVPPLITPTGTIVRGIPTSKGIYKGTLRVVRGINDFHKLQEGDVLVIPFSDVGWTPLFPRAGAIIAESGGFLSHSSIVAREYHIPAVVSVPGMCKYSDGTLVTVDGYRGAISIHQTAQ